MPISANYAACPRCGNEKKLRKQRNGPVVVKDHNRWDGQKMVHCNGSGKEPGKSLTPSTVIFRAG